MTRIEYIDKNVFIENDTTYSTPHVSIWNIFATETNDIVGAVIVSTVNNILDYNLICVNNNLHDICVYVMHHMINKIYK